jgi:hypothetical protein
MVVGSSAKAGPTPRGVLSWDIRELAPENKKRKIKAEKTIFFILIKTIINY